MAEPGRPHPVGRIAARQSTGDRTVAIEGCRLAPEALEGKTLVLAYGYAPTIEPQFRYPTAFVRGAVGGPGGAVLVLLPGPLASCVPAAAAGDLVYLDEEIADARVREERAEVEAWKAARRAEHG